MERDTNLDKQWIIERIAYLDYLAHKLRPRKAILKFNDWAASTMQSLNKIHSNIHIKTKSLKNIIRNSL